MDMWDLALITSWVLSDYNRMRCLTFWGLNNLFKSCFLWRGRNLQKNMLNKKTLILYYAPSSILHLTRPLITLTRYTFVFVETNPDVSRRPKMSVSPDLHPGVQMVALRTAEVHRVAGQVVKLGKGCQLRWKRIVGVFLPCPKYNKGGKYSFLMCFRYQVYVVN